MNSKGFGVKPRDFGQKLKGKRGGRIEGPGGATPFCGGSGGGGRHFEAGAAGAILSRRAAGSCEVKSRF